jgi:hypothetical protein
MLAKLAFVAPQLAVEDAISETGTLGQILVSVVADYRALDSAL